MPTYEYVCKQCEERLEVFQSFSAKPLRTHEGCGGSLQKVFHPSGVVFKGSGFYVTDNRSASNGASTPSKDSKDSGSSDSSTTAKSDSSSSSSSVSDAADD